MVNLMINKFKIDINVLFQLINVVIILFFINIYNNYKYSDFVDENTFIYASLLSISNIFFLRSKLLKFNPFIIIIILVVTIFYLLRIFSLYYFSYSAVLSRDNITPSDLNSSIIYILLCNFCIFLGLVTVESLNVKLFFSAHNIYNKKKLRSSVFILLLALTFIFINNLGYGGGEIGAFLILIFFHQEAILLFTLCFIIFYYNSISKGYLILFVILLLTFILYITLAGSRAGILTILTLFLFSLLAVKKIVKFNFFTILLICLIMPFSFVFYLTATFNRDLDVKIKNPIELFIEMRAQDVFESEKVELLSAKLTDRIGFLDYNTILISRSYKYDKVINFQFYFKSLIDNFFSPGFDVFDTPKASLALGMVANNESTIKKSKIGDFYQSDMLGIYGEYFILFNKYFSLVLFYFTAVIFQLLYKYFETNNQFKSILFKSLLLSIFYTWINSFGIDWIIIEAFTMFVTGFIIKKFYY